MDQNKSSSAVRDLFLLIILIILVINAYKNAYTFLALHNNSLIHELDRSFTDQLFTVQRQFRITKSILEGRPANKNQDTLLEKLIEKVAKIEKKYTKNSHGIALLGPIGSAYIVLKENELKQQFLDVINELGRLLYTIAGKEKTFSSSQTIDAGIANNQTLISELFKKN